LLKVQESRVDRFVAFLAGRSLSVLGAVTSPRLSILTFHRVHPNTDSLYPNEPDARSFELLMRFVARSFRTMGFSEALQCLTDGNLPPRALVITFDDGYADNAEVALPILRRHGLKATFFISTGFLDGGLMWNDTVVECVRACRHTELDLEAFHLGRYSLAGLAERREVISTLLPRIKYLGLAERELATTRLQRACGVADLPMTLMMRSEQVRQVHQAGMEIGGHTVHHPILTKVSPIDAETEVSEGRARLQEIIDASVDTFAYPNGKPGRDYDDSHVVLLKRLGFRGAVTTVAGVCRAGDDLLQLPRFTPWGTSLGAWTLRLLLNQRNTRFETATRP
jgi:peptidoglycan/xylan/chitin deacetylase (PgdA/CDA1 family)